MFDVVGPPHDAHALPAAEWQVLQQSHPHIAGDIAHEPLPDAGTCDPGTFHSTGIGGATLNELSTDEIGGATLAELDPPGGPQWTSVD